MSEEPTVDDSDRAMTAGERVAAVWEISKSAWAWKSRTFDEPAAGRPHDLKDVEALEQF